MNQKIFVTKNLGVVCSKKFGSGVEKRLLPRYFYTGIETLEYKYITYFAFFVRKICHVKKNQLNMIHTVTLIFFHHRNILAWKSRNEISGGILFGEYMYFSHVINNAHKI